MKRNYLKQAGVKGAHHMTALNKETRTGMENDLKWTEAIIDQAIETATDYATIAILKSES